MIRHIVMWRLAGESADEQRQARERVKEAFESLRGRVPGLQEIEVGFDLSAADYACDVVLVADFESQHALDGYATHPEHLRVREELAALRIARHQVDYQRH
ncbi:Dabb family protein [Paraburkholderia bannensis]|uniref:Dabb family protein n=1 Tax=Paraburkholderia bannensis TaxID=765414 RepID=UPI002ABD66E1|nr:Dabb family protein [Paraburkholderia bannensis]